MLARLRIGPKLLLAPGAVLFLLVLLSCSAYYAMLRQNASLESIVGQRAANMRAASDLAAQSQKAHADIYRLLSWMGGSFPFARTEPLRRDILIGHERIAGGLSQLARMTGPHAAERRHVEQAISAHQAYTAAVRDVIELAPLDGSISANAMLKAESAFAVVAQRLADLAVIEETLSRRASSSAQSDFRVASTLMPIVILLAIGVSLAITFAVRRLLLDEIRGIGAAVSGLASGDLTVRERAYGGDEIAETSRALDASIRHLNGTLRSILESARVIGIASRDIKLGSLSMGSRAVFRPARCWTPPAPCRTWRPRPASRPAARWRPTSSRPRWGRRLGWAAASWTACWRRWNRASAARTGWWRSWTDWMPWRRRRTGWRSTPAWMRRARAWMPRAWRR